MDQNQMKKHTNDGYEGSVPAASVRAQQEAAGRGKNNEQQKHDDDGDVPAASARAQQAADRGRKHEQEQEQEQPASSLNPTAARLLREAIVSQPDGGKPAAAAGSSDILAFVRAVDRVDSPLE